MSLLNGFLGGCLIGTGAAICLLGGGHIMGFSGIIRPIIQNPIKAAKDPSQQWKLAFLSSFLLSAYAFLLPTADADKISTVASVTSPLAYALSGVCVGVGTTIGNGCTSGHGICGLPRFSKRSFAAVLTFMGMAVATTVVTKGPAFDMLRDGANEAYLPSWVMASVTAGMIGLALYGAWATRQSSTDTPASKDQATKPAAASATTTSTTTTTTTTDKAAATSATPLVDKDQQDTKSNKDERIPAALAGVVAGAGLSLSTMVYPAAVRGFLDVTLIPQGTWDPTLMMVMGGGLVTSFMSYQFLPQFAVVKACPKMDNPWAGSKFGVPTNQAIDAPLLSGAALFGIGWGLTGLCPGPALLLTMTGLQGMVLQWWPSFWVGSRLGEMIKGHC